MNAEMQNSPNLAVPERPEVASLAGPLLFVACDLEIQGVRQLLLRLQQIGGGL